MTSQDILLLCHGLVSESLPLLTKRDRYTHKLTWIHTLMLFYFFYFFIFTSSMYDTVYLCVFVETKPQLSLLQTPDCPLPAACSCLQLLREGVRKLRSAAGPTCTSWWTLALRYTLKTLPQVIYSKINIAYLYIEKSVIYWCNRRVFEKVFLKWTIYFPAAPPESEEIQSDIVRGLHPWDAGSFCTAAARLHQLYAC